MFTRLAYTQPCISILSVTRTHTFLCIFLLFIVVCLSSLRILFFFIVIETFLPFPFFLRLVFFFPVIFLFIISFRLIRFLFSSRWCFYLLGIHHIFFRMFQLIFLWTTSVKCYAFLDCAETKCHGIVWALFLVKNNFCYCYAVLLCSKSIKNTWQNNASITLVKIEILSE